MSFRPSKLSCRTARRDLTTYLDGELASPQGQLLAAHLEQCPGCRAYSTELRAVQSPVHEVLSAYPHARASADFDRGVWEKLAARQSRPLSLIERIDALFARPVLKLLASGAGGISCGLLLIGILSALGGSVPVTSSDLSASPKTAATTTPSTTYAVTDRGSFNGALASRNSSYAWLNARSLDDLDVELDDSPRERARPQAPPAKATPKDSRKTSWKNSLSGTPVGTLPAGASPSAHSSGSLC